MPSTANFLIFFCSSYDGQLHLHVCTFSLFTFTEILILFLLILDLNGTHVTDSSNHNESQSALQKVENHKNGLFDSVWNMKPRITRPPLEMFIQPRCLG